MPVPAPASSYRDSGLVVRPRGCRISTVQVRVGESHSSEAEGNCAAARRGEKQPEANGRSAGNELDSAVCNGEPSTKWRSLKPTGHAAVVVKAMVGCMLWLEVERSEGTAQEVGRPGPRGDGVQESEPSQYRTVREARAREPIGWHRRETRRQTENTNGFLRVGDRVDRESAESKPAPREGG